MQTRTYWRCQLWGWGLYAALSALLFVAGGARGRVLALTVTGAALGLGLTHGLRALARRRGWHALPLAPLALRAFAASALLAAVLFGGQLALGRALGAFPGRGLSTGGVLVGLANWSAVFLCWQLIYFGVHALRGRRDAELQAARATAAARTAEVRALEAQLNPHFLFNALNGIRGLVSEDPARAQAALTHLAATLRYTLAAPATDTVPLREELRVVQDYLALEAIRLEERLVVELDVEPAALGARVPPLLVQALVENAVKHGVARLPAGGRVVVRARLEAGALRLDVLNTRARDARGPAPEGSGVGLANAQERLRLLFGEAASVRLESAAGDLTAARVSIPVRA